MPKRRPYRTKAQLQDNRSLHRPVEVGIGQFSTLDNYGEMVDHGSYRHVAAKRGRPDRSSHVSPHTTFTPLRTHDKNHLGDRLDTPLTW